MELDSLVWYLLKVNPLNWPDCDQILNYPPVKQKIDLFFPQNYTNPTSSNMLATIKLESKNLMSISLPESNYKMQIQKLQILDKVISQTVPTHPNVIDIESEDNFFEEVDIKPPK